MFTITFEAPSGKTFMVVASGETMKDLTQGYNPGSGRAPRANGELKGVPVRYHGRKPHQSAA